MLVIINPSTNSRFLQCFYSKSRSISQAQSQGAALLPKLTSMLSGPSENAGLTLSGHSSAWQDRGNTSSLIRFPRVQVWPHLWDAKLKAFIRASNSTGEVGKAILMPSGSRIFSPFLGMCWVSRFQTRQRLR